MTVSEELTEAWARCHVAECWQESAFIRGLLSLKTAGPGVGTALRPSECAPGEEAALVGGLLLGSRDVYAAILALPDEEFPFAQGFSNAALGRVFDVLTDAFDVPDYDLSRGEIQDALDRAGLFGSGAMEMDDELLTSLMRCAGRVFDLRAMTAREDGIRDCALAVLKARLERIRARREAYGTESTTDGDRASRDGEQPSFARL